MGKAKWWLLAGFVLLAAVLGLVALGSRIQDQATPAASAEAVQPPLWQRPSQEVRQSYRHHRGQFEQVAGYSRGVRTNRWLAVIGFLLFALVTLPKNARGIRAFYGQLVATHPLPPQAGTKAGEENDENNRRARQVLFFYLLFLLYQIVQFPLTWGRDNAVQFVSDLVFQAMLLAGVTWTYGRLKAGLKAQWPDDAQARGKLSAVLSAKLEGLPLRWRDLRRLAALMFAGAFTPALLAKLPDWLDVLTNFRTGS